MEGLTKEESAFFESGGKADISDATEVEKTEEVKTEEKSAVKTEVKVEEKKKPSKFTYSEDTDNVQDDLGRKYVPLGAVQEARNENKTLRKELDELKSKWTGGEEKLSKLMAALTDREKTEEIPDYTKDPLGNLSAKNKALEEKISALEKSQGRMTEESAQEKTIREFSTRVTSAERVFASQNPDYADAVAVVQSIWRAELETAGVPEQLIEATLARRGAAFSHAAMQKDQNPAEAVYKLAQKLGHKKTEKESPSKEKETLKTIAKGQEAEKSLPSGKGSADFNLDVLASMSEDEMEDFVKDPKNWKKLQRAA
jgi:hypothetical protein